MLGLIGNIALPELLLIAALAVILFGKRLPEVAARGYASFRRLRLKLEDLRRDTGIDDELREIQRNVHQATHFEPPDLRAPYVPPVPREGAPPPSFPPQPPRIEQTTDEDARSAGATPGPPGVVPPDAPARPPGPDAAADTDRDARSADDPDSAGGDAEEPRGEAERRERGV